MRRLADASGERHVPASALAPRLWCHTTHHAPATPVPPILFPLSPSCPPDRSRYDIDFLNLSYCNQEEDLYSARAFLDSVGMQQTKIVAKVWCGVCVCVVV